MKNNQRLILVLGLAASALTMVAQNAPLGPRHAGGIEGGPTPTPPRPHLLANLDANQDRALSAEELQGAPLALLALDFNQDGIVSADELCPPNHRPGGGPGRGPRHGFGPVPGPGNGRGAAADATTGNAVTHAPSPAPKPPVIAAVDLDDDNTLSAEEIAAAPQSLLQLDANQDGLLTRDELRPEWAQGPGGPGPRHNGQGRGFGRGQGHGFGFRGGIDRPAPPQPESPTE